MTAEQIISIITEHKNFCAICVGEDNREVRRDWQISSEQMPVIANKLLAFIEQEKIDLLKEFVEFAKGEFIKANYCYNDTYLDTMLDMFLEERK